MQLVRNGDGLRRAVAVLAQDQIRLAPTRVVPLERVRPMQKYDHVRILLKTIM